MGIDVGMSWDNEIRIWFSWGLRRSQWAAILGLKVSGPFEPLFSYGHDFAMALNGLERTRPSRARRD